MAVIARKIGYSSGYHNIGGAKKDHKTKICGGIRIAGVVEYANKLKIRRILIHNMRK